MPSKKAIFILLTQIDRKITALDIRLQSIERAIDYLADKIDSNAWISIKDTYKHPEELEGILLYDPGQVKSCQVNEGFYTDGRYQFVRGGSETD
jgi:hypothetical protein